MVHIQFLKYFATKWLFKNLEMSFTIFGTMKLFKIFRMMLCFLNLYPPIIFMNTIRTLEVRLEILRMYQNSQRYIRTI